MLNMPRICSNLWIVAVLLLCIFQTCHSEDEGRAPEEWKWFEQKHHHEPSELDDETFEYLATVGERVNFKRILKPLLVPREAGSENNIAVQEYISDYLTNLGWTIDTDSFEDETPLGTKSFTNIIATMDPEIHRTLSFACHFDSLYHDGDGWVTAIDSAVPCAQMLHLAKVMKSLLDEQKDSQPDVTLQYIFFDGEEPFANWTDTDSLYGSRHLASAWESVPYPPGNEDDTNMLHRMDLMVLLDLLGIDGSTDPYDPSLWSYFPKTHSWYTIMQDAEEQLKKANFWNGPPDYVIFKGPKVDKIGDDHLPFLQRGVDILHMITSPFPTVWHTEDDTIDNLDFPTIENLNKVFRIFVAKYLHISAATY